MGDQDDGFPLGAQPFEDAEQLIRLGGGQNACGLIKDQDIGMAVKLFEDLDPLLMADAQILDDRVGIDFQPVFLG